VQTVEGGWGGRDWSFSFLNKEQEVEGWGSGVVGGLMFGGGAESGRGQW